MQHYYEIFELKKLLIRKIKMLRKMNFKATKKKISRKVYIRFILLESKIKILKH